MGIKNGKGSKKMAKKDMEAEVPQGAKEMIAKFFGGLFSRKGEGEERIVTEIIEEASSNLLFAGITNSKNASDIEIYDLSKNGFSLIKRITFEDINTLTIQRVG